MGAEKSKAFLKPGNHETEVCYGSEDEFYNLYTRCRKNPGHVNFIPAKEFTLRHIPPSYRDVILFELIKVLCALTVLIKINYTSIKRPASGGWFKGQYPCYNNRSNFALRTGTGRVVEVIMHKMSDNKGPCPCENCRNSNTPSKVWGEVYVSTATQVVFNTNEAKQTSCVVGFDDHKSPGVTLDGSEVREADIETDRCQLTCVSCDLHLLEELDKMCHRFDELRIKLEDKYRRNAVNNVAVIVSHPHGCPKQISFGKWTHKRDRKGWTQFTYSTSTCPGSSGASVYMPGCDSSVHEHIHCGSNSKGNYSG